MQQKNATIVLQEASAAAVPGHEQSSTVAMLQSVVTFFSPCNFHIKTMNLIEENINHRNN